MSRSLGYFADDTPQDYPELNKCPDCETFFASESCPLCGKICPEEFRAGNRRPVKPGRTRRTNSGWRTVVPWYHTVWFIIAMLILQPVIGLILTWTSPWRTWAKVLATVVVLLPYLLGYLLGGFTLLLGLFS